MRKLIYGLFAMSGMVMAALGIINANEAKTSIPTTTTPAEDIAQMNNTVIDFADMMPSKENIILAYHYSHSSHSSHTSHTSHYSARF